MAVDRSSRKALSYELAGGRSSTMCPTASRTSSRTTDMTTSPKHAGGFPAQSNHRSRARARRSWRGPAMAKMFINGEPVDAQAGKTLDVKNPANGSVVDSVPRGTAADVDAAVEAAAKAFPAWAALPPSKRAQLMHAAAEKMKAAVPEIARLLSQEQGKPLAHAVLEASRVQENLEYYAGLPPGVLNVVHGSGAEIGDALVSHKKVNKVAFTGQTETGKRIMKLAAENVTRVTLELGGSDPMIVCDDADLRRASAATAIGRFFNAGQACLAVKRVYVFASVAEEFMTKIADRARKEWKVGDGLAEGTKMGPLHTEHQRAEVEAQVADAVKNGARVLAGGTRPTGDEFAKGWFMEATVLTDVPEDSRMLREEVFGPALPIVIVNDLDEAIAKANSSVYGLGSSIWTKDLAKARKAMEQIQAGYTWVNDIQVAYDQLPFGGSKQSGFGKEHGLEALDGYLEKKSVVLSAG